MREDEKTKDRSLNRSADSGDDVKEPQNNTENKMELESLPSGTEKVLLVDDEERSLSVMKTLLEKLGYQVTPMSCSVEALELFREDPYRYDLLLTDLIMPRLNGDELVSEIIALRPDMPVIITSGFLDTVDNDKFNQISNKAFISKPYEAMEFSKTIREILDRKG